MKIDHEEIIIIRDGGNGSFGSLTDASTNDSIGRYWPEKGTGRPRKPWAVGAVFIDFFGSATGTATLNLYCQSHVPTTYRTTGLGSTTARGIVSTAGDADYLFIISARDYLSWYVFGADEDLVVTWTNPGTIPWSLRILAHPAIP